MQSGFQAVNVQVDVTITDQGGPSAPVPAGAGTGTRTISASAADGFRSSVRSGSKVKFGEGFADVGLSLDIRPVVVAPTKARVEIGFESSAVGDVNDQGKLPGTRITQTVVLESGKPVVLSQTTDPVTGRKTTVEAKATILR